MSKQIVPVNSNLHQTVRVLRDPTFNQAKDAQLVPVVVQEVMDCAIEYPVVLVKNAHSGQFVLVAMMGLKSGENLYCGEVKFDGHYVPQVLRHYPFVLQATPNSEHMLLSIDEHSPLVNQQEGEHLFDSAGEQSPFLVNKAKALQLHHEQQQITESFVALLLQYQLLSQQQLTIQLGAGQPTILDGVYLVDQKRLDELSEAEYLALRKNGALAIIHAHLLSLKQLNRLARRALTL
ncbi:MAG: SapC family protein [Paraglaciecola sp.]|nr:SapC family protein [Paraglaciecola sp.]NCT49859.1 SapC family protein [Paraglaciecola sp.]